MAPSPLPKKGVEILFLYSINTLAIYIAIVHFICVALSPQLCGSLLKKNVSSKRQDLLSLHVAQGKVPYN